jgi:hypothetical protein
MSIGEIGDELRRLIAALPFAHGQAALDHLDQAIATLAAVTYGSTSAEASAALAYFAQGRKGRADWSRPKRPGGVVGGG